MINLHNARKFCKEDISLIENYDKAKRDLLETLDLHNRKEEEGYSRQDLIDLGLYNKRPASELIFLTRSEHLSLHKKGNKNWFGKKHSVETRKKLSEAMKGNKHCLGRTGEKHPMYGKTGDKNPCSKPVLQIDKKTVQVIKTWPCAMEVQRVLGINNGNISECCSGKRKSCGGYIWRYAKSESLT